MPSVFSTYIKHRPLLLMLNDAGPQPTAPTGAAANAVAPRVHVTCCNRSSTVAKKPVCCGHGTTRGTVASGDMTPQPAMDWPITAYDAQPQPSAVSYATGTTILPLTFSGAPNSMLDGACGKRRT